MAKHVASGMAERPYSSSAHTYPFADAGDDQTGLIEYLDPIVFACQTDPWRPYGLMNVGRPHAKTALVKH